MPSANALSSRDSIRSFARCATVCPQSGAFPAPGQGAARWLVRSHRIAERFCGVAGAASGRTASKPTHERDACALRSIPAFIELPPAETGIQLGPRERDVAGALPARDLRTGLRVPRLRQRRLDGHLPGELGPGRLLHAEDAAAQRALQEQSRRHVHRRHREGRRAGRHLRHGRRGRRLRQRRLSRPVRDGVRASARCITTTATARSPTSPRRAGLEAPGLDDERGLVRLRQRRQARPVRVQLRRVLAEDQRLLRRQQARAALLLHSAHLQADAEPALPQQRRRHVHRGRQREPTSNARSARRSAWSAPTSTTTA